MNALKNILFKAGFIRLTDKRVEAWIAEGKIEELVYALSNGSFQIRELAVRGLGMLKSQRSIDLICSTLDDKVKPVSFAAIKALESFDISPEQELKIESTKEFWLKEELREKESARTFFSKKLPNYYTRERGSKQTLEQAKQMLKKPMLGGKWF